MKRITSIPIELLFWIMALLCLAMAKPETQGHVQHLTLCPLANLGIEWCPGCGIGRSITHLLHGNLAMSLTFHWFGVPALIIILFRIWTLGKLYLKCYKSYKLI
jgi:hypothetical protein